MRIAPILGLGLLATALLATAPPAAAHAGDIIVATPLPYPGCTTVYLAETQANQRALGSSAGGAGAAFVASESSAAAAFQAPFLAYAGSTQGNAGAYPGWVQTMGPFAATDRLVLAQSGATGTLAGAAPGAATLFASRTTANALALEGAVAAAAVAFAASQNADTQAYVACVV